MKIHTNSFKGHSSTPLKIIFIALAVFSTFVFTNVEASNGYINSLPEDTKVLEVALSSGENTTEEFTDVPIFTVLHVQVFNTANSVSNTLRCPDPINSSLSSNSIIARTRGNFNSFSTFNLCEGDTTGDLNFDQATSLGDTSRYSVYYVERDLRNFNEKDIVRNMSTTTDMAVGSFFNFGYLSLIFILFLFAVWCVLKFFRN